MKRRPTFFLSDILIGLFFICAGVLYIAKGENSYIAIHDNLDLFQPQFQMMKDEGTFFTRNVGSGFLGGISRDVMPSEWSLTTFLYILLPGFPAYIVNWFFKCLIGFFSMKLLAGELLGKEKNKYHTLINLCAFAYGAINFFPCFGVPFTSIPLAVFLILKIERSESLKRSIKWYVALFVYPFISYFSYIGFFILAYMAVALVIVSIWRRHFDFRMLVAIIVLSIGYVLFEYRLFGMMLFSDEITIRSTMVLADNTLGQAMHEMWDVFVNNSFHADALTGKLVMPVCMLYFLIINIKRIIKKEWKSIFKCPYNLVIALLVFNSLIYGLYTCSFMRNLVETLVPPLTGFQFDRTSFFNPFLWVCALFMVCKTLWDKFLKLRTEICSKHNVKAHGELVCGYTCAIISLALVFIYIATILLTPTRYNDLRATAWNTVKSDIYGNEIDDFNYREFFGTEVYSLAKEDIGYNGEWSVAYGFYPAQLEYNGINTLDGYLGFYSQEYKEEFRKIIAPALDRVPASRLYYDNWGARAYLFSGSQDSIVSATKSFEPVDTELFIDVKAFKDMGGRFIFSRYKLTGEVAESLIFRGEYSCESAPYNVYVYDAQ